MRTNESKRTTIGAIATLLLAALAVGSLAFAQPPRRGGDGPGPGFQGRMRFDDRLVEFLGLTEEQQAEWKSIHEANRDAILGILEQLRTNHEALEDAIDAVDALLVGQLTLEGRRLQEQVKASQEDLRTQLQGVLTTEQVERWEAFRAANGDGPRFRRHGPRRGPGPGGDA